MPKNVFTTRTVIVRLLIVGLAYFYRPLYEFIRETPEAYLMLDILVTILMRRFTSKPAKFKRPKGAPLGILMIFTLVGCSTVNQSLDPNVIYKRDIELEINGERFVGFAIPKKSVTYEIKIKAQGVIDMLTITSCHREESIETSHEFWESGKSFTYQYTPIYGIEDGSGCLLDIGAYEKIKGRHSWATIDFQTDNEKLPAQTLCGGKFTSYGGVSACQSKNGLLQKINFSERVKVSPDNERCNVMQTKNDMEFFYTTPKGECTFYFGTKDGRFHRHTTFGYDGILIREVN